MKPRVFLGIPTYDRMVHLYAALQWTMGATKGGLEVFRSESTSSLLPDAFNSLWCDALNRRAKHGFTYFAMLHADVAPEDGWLDTLVNELEMAGADMVSAVIPIKDGRGVTSTAIDDPNDPWTPLRRLTLKEVYNLPETFGAKEAGYPGYKLLANTGCWVARIDRPWAERHDRVYFDIRARIVKVDGRLERQVIPEDWFFSRAIQAEGGKVLATRMVRVLHHGCHAYSNASPWGTWSQDERRAEVEKRLAKIRQNDQAVVGAGLEKETPKDAAVAVSV